MAIIYDTAPMDYNTTEVTPTKPKPKLIKLGGSKLMIIPINKNKVPTKKETPVKKEEPIKEQTLAYTFSELMVPTQPDIEEYSTSTKVQDDIEDKIADAVQILDVAVKTMETITDPELRVKLTKSVADTLLEIGRCYYLAYMGTVVEDDIDEDITTEQPPVKEDTTPKDKWEEDVDGLPLSFIRADLGEGFTRNENLSPSSTPIRVSNEENIDIHPVDIPGVFPLDPKPGYLLTRHLGGVEHDLAGNAIMYHDALLETKISGGDPSLVIIKRNIFEVTEERGDIINGVDAVDIEISELLSDDFVAKEGDILYMRGINTGVEAIDINHLEHLRYNQVLTLA